MIWTEVTMENLVSNKLQELETGMEWQKMMKNSAAIRARWSRHQ
ncbi:MAG: hypothetical protein Ct9H300mP21_02010 [Pseudomonadota bacterium]|nr:MAG: hypothetical protein Ct9H300mP21_02010 [Pseudomonadota bacterium]